MAYTYEYPRPAVTVDAVVLLKEEEKLKILLIERKFAPFANTWAFPGGFLDEKETAETAVSRELEEETGLQGIKFTQGLTVSTPDRDPRGRTVSIIYYGFTDASNKEVKGGDDAKQAKWFSIDQLPDLAFDHATILEEILSTYKWTAFE